MPSGKSRRSGRSNSRLRADPDDTFRSIDLPPGARGSGAPLTVTDSDPSFETRRYNYTALVKHGQQGWQFEVFRVAVKTN